MPSACLSPNSSRRRQQTGSYLRLSFKIMRISVVADSNCTVVGLVGSLRHCLMVNYGLQTRPMEPLA